MMAIKLVIRIWNKTFLILFIADEVWWVCKRRFNCLKMAIFNAEMTIAVMMYITADMIYRVFSSNSTINWTFESVAIIMIVTMVAESGTFSVLLEKGR